MAAHPADGRQPAGGHRQDPDLPGGVRRLPAPAVRRRRPRRCPSRSALEQVELLGTEVVPVLRKELAARRAPDVPDAPTHASLVAAKYGDAEPRQPRPNPNRGDNLSGTSPYQDSDPERRSPLPAGGVMSTRDIRLANEAWEALLPRPGHPRPRVRATTATGATCSRASTACSTRCPAAPTGCGSRELCDDVLLTQAGISRLVARLEKRGLVERGERPGRRPGPPHPPHRPRAPRPSAASAAPTPGTSRPR